MKLGYVDPESGEFVEASSVQLSTKMSVGESAALRKACYEGTRTIGPCIAEELISVIKLRNKLAKLVGFQDFYDMTVLMAEGFGKDSLFTILEDLEKCTKELSVEARKHLVKIKRIRKV